MSDRVLTIRDLRLSRGTRQVLKDVDLAASRGDLVALMGLSGGGKTTVLRCVAALEPFDGGEIEVDGAPLRPGPLPRTSALAPLRAKVGMVFQLHCLFDHLTVLQNVTLAPIHVHRAARGAAEARARGLADALGVAHRLSAYPRELSGGEAQRVAIARSLAMDPPLLLMDEPTASLDPARRTELGETLRELTAEGRALVVTTHDEDFVKSFATRVVVMAEGEVVEEGDPREVLTNPQHPATKRLLSGDRAPAH
ncbi:MAG TPA: ATP-binding cassette domain-containing protein [Thermoanaerobaculia bacterium]|nr:ATP-binding cassette domain-containing protein [Thermoanaerobaculia bacterium]